MRLNKGAGLIEVIVGLAVILTAFVSIVSVYNFFLRTSVRNTSIIKAEYLLSEGVEAVRSIRDNSWANFYNISLDNDIFLAYSNDNWNATTTNNLIDGVFERKFQVRDVYRDNYDDISETGYLDDGSREINIFVSWMDSGATTTISEKIILANIFE